MNSSVSPASERSAEGASATGGTRMPNDRMRSRIKGDLAEALQRIEAIYTEQAEEPEVAKRILSETVAVMAAARPAESSDRKPSPLTLDLDSEPETPDSIVRGLIERGTVVLLSGDTGAAKSICVDALAVAICHEDDWLGHETHAERVLVVDEENPERVVRSRLRALGMQNEARERLRWGAALRRPPGHARSVGARSGSAGIPPTGD